MKRYIKAASVDLTTQIIKKAYNEISAAKLADMCGCTISELGSADQLSGYDAQHLGWYIAKDKYSEILEDYDSIELVREGDAGKEFLGTTVGYKLIDVTDEIAKLLGM